MGKRVWYTAKGIFRHEPSAENAKPWYEERIVLIKADSEEDAIKQAAQEARKYSKAAECQLVEIVEAWEIHDDKLIHGTEIFSSKNISTLGPSEYLEQFYPDAPEDCEAIGDKHSWHNLDGERSACYNCHTIQSGKLW